MILVLAWRANEQLVVCADTRIASGNPITDAGQKVFVVPEISILGADVRRLVEPSGLFPGGGAIALVSARS
jgi:hypothetical protein